MIDCKINVPYPPVKTEGKNQNYAALLTNDFAGSVSEMSAVTNYIFQSLITRNKEIAETMKCISMVEMHHMDMLGELIVCFGSSPKIGAVSGCSIRYWNGQYLCYDEDPLSYLKVNIANENKAIETYKGRITQINDCYAKKVIERIIMDEEHHIMLFQGLLKKYCQR